MIQRYVKADFSRNLINLQNGTYNVSNDNYEYEMVISNNHVNISGKVKGSGTYTSKIPVAVQPPLYDSVWYTFSAQNIDSVEGSSGLTSIYCASMNGSRYWNGKLYLLGSKVVDGFSAKSSIGFCNRFLKVNDKYEPNTNTGWSLYLYLSGGSSERPFSIQFDFMLNLGHTATEFEPYDKTKSVYITKTLLLYPATTLYPATNLYPVDPKYGIQVREDH